MITTAWAVQQPRCSHCPCWPACSACVFLHFLVFLLKEVNSGVERLFFLHSLRRHKASRCRCTSVPSTSHMQDAQGRGVGVQMHYLAHLLRKVDIAVDMDKVLQEQAAQAAAAESLGSLELPQGRPSPSDGPTRQDDIAGPLFPAQPPMVSQSVSPLHQSVSPLHHFEPPRAG